MFCVVVVIGVTQLHDVVYIVCERSSTILRFNATTHERLTDMDVKDLKHPRDIVACEQTSQLYVSDSCREGVWRVSADGADIKRWWPKSSTDFRPTSLSVTSTRLLLVTSFDRSELIQLDSLGKELRCVRLPNYMIPVHAVESPTTTFIISHWINQFMLRQSDDVVHVRTQLDQHHISEVNTNGQVLRQFTGSRLPPFGRTPRIAIDSHGNLFVADCDNRRILLLDAQLKKLRRVILDKHQLNYKQPSRLCYREPTGQLLVALDNTVAVFDVLRR